MSAPERHADKVRNLILNHAVTDLEEIINAHNPDVDAPIKQGVWDRLDKMAMLIEAKAIARADPTQDERVKALVEAAQAQLDYMDMCRERGDLERNLRAALRALEQGKA